LAIPEHEHKPFCHVGHKGTSPYGHEKGCWTDEGWNARCDADCYTCRNCGKVYCEECAADNGSCLACRLRLLLRREFVSKFPASVTDVVVMTIAQFLGKRISEAGDSEKTAKSIKQPELTSYDSIFIDEFFQSSAWDIIGMVRRLLKLRAQQTPTDKEEELRAYHDCLLGRVGDALVAAHNDVASATTTTELEAARVKLAELEKKDAAAWRSELFPKRTKVFANGDTFHLTNQESWNAVGDKQEFCDTFLWRVFPKRIRLRENFRLTDPAERPVLMNILRQLKLGVRCDEETGEALESTHGFILRVLKDNGLAGQVFTDPAFVERGGKPMPCIAWSNVMGNAINQRFRGDEAVGMEVVCRAYMMKKVTDKETGVAKKVGLRTNKVYKVLSIKDGYYGIREDDKPDTPVKLYPRLKFPRNIAQTAHAVQGETIAQDFAIFEFGSNPDWRWVYVSESRASSLRQAWFYDGVPLFKRRELGEVIREKLASYVEQDKAAGRSTDKFVTEKWVMEKLKSQNYCCAERECMRPLLLEWDATDEEERGQQVSVDRRTNSLGHVLGNCRLACLRCNLAAAHEGKQAFSRLSHVGVPIPSVKDCESRICVLRNNNQIAP